MTPAVQCDIVFVYSVDDFPAIRKNTVQTSGTVSQVLGPDKIWWLRKRSEFGEVPAGEF
jgi:hypothetical protein